MEINQQILESLLDIPKWKVTTYKNLARKFSVHPRKIAQTMKYNKNPEIYPCYKVVASTWKVWWYSWKWWIWGKINMLREEGIIIINGKIEDNFII